MTVSIVLNGILFGILLSFLFGPAFFILINTSIKKGFKEAFSLILAFYLVIYFTFLLPIYLQKKINAYLHNNIYIKLAAGIAFIILGIVYILKKDTDVSEKSSNNSNQENQQSSLLGLTAKGIGLNAINPEFSFIGLQLVPMQQKL